MLRCVHTCDFLMPHTICAYDLSPGQLERNIYADAPCDWRDVSHILPVEQMRGQALCQQYMKEPYLFISELAVRPKFRRQGIARALLKAADDAAIHYGFEGLKLRPYPSGLMGPWEADKATLVEIAKRLGFVEVPAPPDGLGPMLVRPLLGAAPVPRLSSLVPRPPSPVPRPPSPVPRPPSPVSGGSRRGCPPCRL